MSTGFTKMAADFDVTLQPLGQALIQAHQWLSTSLLNLMHERGHRELTSAHLTFFNSLNCGMTHASDVARRMGITRQAVYKVTRELQRLGILDLVDDPEDGRQKIISMTKRGEQIALDARECLERVEAQLADQIGRRNLEVVRDALAKDWGPVIERGD